MYVLTCHFCILYFTLLLFLKVLSRLFFFVHESFACIYVWVPQACLVSVEVIRQHWTPGNCTWVVHVGVENWTRVLCNKSSYRLRHFSSPPTSLSSWDKLFHSSSGWPWNCHLPAQPPKARILGEVGQQGRILFRNLCCTLQVFTLLFTQSLNSYLSLQKNHRHQPPCSTLKRKQKQNPATNNLLALALLFNSCAHFSLALGFLPRAHRNECESL